MSVLSHFTKRSSVAMEVTENPHSSILPVVFIPHFVVDKIKALGLDYQTVFSKIGYNELDIYRDNDTSSVVEFNKLIGINESIALAALNRKMFNNCYGYNQCIQRFTNFILSENDYNKEIVKLTEQLSKLGNGDPYIIENNTDCFFVIMNSNSFTTFDETYKEMSRDLCGKLVQFIDESFVFQSVFFKSL